MSSRLINYRAWGVFSLFVWLHTAPAIYPFPWQQYEDIQLDAIETAKIESKLRRDNPGNRTSKEWEDDLIASTWVLWIESTLYLTFGLLFSWLMFINARRWPILMGGLSAIALLQTLPNLYKLATVFGSYSESLGPWARLIPKWLQEGDLNQLLTAYIIWIWPIYGIVLLWISLRAMWHRKRNHDPVA